ncbi:MAG: repair protein RadC protein [Candidatus Roizmanbacteria bacterium GW2011_GWA1_41_13]|uniref:Repair protein RadC protein n=1 Tax=Candidatus Roizmanbacteria bacterium GW2011_GWA1_41_13 TaxID=1618474 RepID=A0A0G0XD98_9BACT|nr:MAG: repair protein RadC protein [Candidatus Roizmanbacteria bacterium GW2011_GWA1_41_13]
MRVKDLPLFKRPREKLFEKGPQALKDYELLAILLRTGYEGKSATSSERL